MKGYHPKLIIFYAERADRTSEQNDKRTLLLKAIMEANSIEYSNVTGCYQGTTEKAFITSDKALDILSFHIFETFDQESYLLLDTDREAFLVYGDDRRESLGYWTRVQKHEAMRSFAYTYVPDTDKYYICIPSD